MSALLTTGVVYVLTFILAYIAIKLFLKKRDSLKRPPCLLRLPIVGSLPVVPGIAKLHSFFLEKSKEIGSIVAFYMCNRYVVVLNGKEAIQEALVKQSLIFSDRPMFYLSNFFKKGRIGIIEHPYNDDFKKFHRLSLNILKTFGFGQGIMESRIRVEVESLLKRVGSKEGQEFDPNYEIKGAVSNVICSIIFGKRWNIDDPEFQEGINIIESQFVDLEKISMINFFPVLRFVPGFRRVIEVQRVIEERFERHLRHMVDVHSKTIESFYKIYREKTEKDMETGEYSLNGKVSEEENLRLLMTIRDLFIAGTETTATTLLWFIVMMANHQDVQKKIRNEIDRVLGKEIHPSLDDKVSLPLLEASLLEVMRIKTLVPLALPHCTLRDTFINDMFIPANTVTFANLYSCHMDPDIWPEPEKFNIERFLDDTKTKVINRDQIVSFSLGKRACLGEILARQEFFLFASALVHEFEILPPVGDENIEAIENVTVTIAPKAFKARFVKRQL